MHEGAVPATFVTADETLPGTKDAEIYDAVMASTFTSAGSTPSGGGDAQDRNFLGGRG